MDALSVSLRVLAPLPLAATRLILYRLAPAGSARLGMTSRLTVMSGAEAGLVKQGVFVWK